MKWTNVTPESWNQNKISLFCFLFNNFLFLFVLFLKAMFWKTTNCIPKNSAQLCYLSNKNYCLFWVLKVFKSLHLCFFHQRNARHQGHWVVNTAKSARMRSLHSNYSCKTNSLHFLPNQVVSVALPLITK